MPLNILKLVPLGRHMFMFNINDCILKYLILGVSSILAVAIISDIIQPFALLVGDAKNLVTVQFVLVVLTVGIE